MADYPQVPLPPWPPGGAPSATVCDAVADWVSSEALADLVRQFGGRPPTGQPDEQLAALIAFSGAWDYRRGSERIHARRVDFDPDVDRLVRSVAGALGLGSPQRPPTGHYDHVLVLGGGVRTGKARAAFAATLLDTSILAGQVAGLGSLRELGEPNLTHAARSGLVGIVTEGDAMLAGLRAAFPPAGPVQTRVGPATGDAGWWVRDYPTSGPPVSVVAAPPTRPGLRANTADTLIGWAELVARPGPADRILLVSTDLYVPYQHCDAVRALGLAYRCGIETVGFDPRRSPGWPGGPSRTDEILQEIRSTILSMNALHQRLSG